MKIQSLTLTLGYPLHRVIYAAAIVEVATSIGLGGDTFTRKYIL